MSRIILITGATSGYGLETAKKFKENGDTVIIASRNAEKVADCVQKYGFDKGYKIDVTDYDQWLELKKNVVNDFGKIDVLVNNAGAGLKIVDTVDQTKESIDSIIKLNLNSAIYGANVFAPIMIEQRDGVIVNISSICARHAWPGWTIYGCAKAGMLSFSKGLYCELQPYGVRVTCVMPGQCSTGFQNNAGIGEVEESLKAKDIANAVFYAVNQPKEVFVEEVTVWGTSQVVQPL